MATLDFSKMVDFSPIEKLGVSKVDGAKFLTALSPIIDIEFQKKIKSAFTSDEMEEIGKEAQSKGIKPEDGMFFLEERYHTKTGNYFMEEMRLLFNEYVVHAANIITQAKSDTDKFAASGDQNVKKFNELMNAEQFEEAAKLLDETVKSSDNTPNQVSSN